MFEKKRFWSLVVLLSASMICNTAFGWAGNIHAKLCQRTFDDPVLQPFLSGIDQSAIENYILEPDGHSVQWSSITNRSYIDTADPIEGFDWNAMDETTRLKTLMHHTGDVCVPANHLPAGYEYPGTYPGEAQAEAQTALWTDLPVVAGTTYYTHTQNGYTEDLDGTIGTIVSKYQAACMNNAAWYEGTQNIFGFHSPSDVSSASWNGMVLGLILQRAVFVDYFLAKQSPVTNYSGDYSVAPGGTVNFNASGAYDPDSVNWSSNGTYYNNGGGIVGYYWDFDYDGTWDWIDNDPLVDRTYSELLAMGIPTNEWVRYNFAIQDNEGKWASDSDFLYLSTSGLPEPATMSLLVVGGLALLRRRNR